MLGIGIGALVVTVVKGYGQHLPGQRALAICAAAEQFLDDMVGEPKS